MVGNKQATECVLTSAFDQPTLLLAALEEGVSQVVSLEQGPEALMNAIAAAKTGDQALSLGELYSLVLAETPSRELNQDLLRLVGDLPQKLESNLRRLQSVWKKGDAAELENFELKSLTGLVDKLPVKTASELVIRLQRSGLLDGE